jgi:hypothetical protein
VLVKGRHWQVPSRIFFGDGKGHFAPGPALPSKASKSYSGSLADMTKSSHLDMVLSNDDPDPKLVLLNDGKGNFSIGGYLWRSKVVNKKRDGWRLERRRLSGYRGCQSGNDELCLLE